jgi:hypothetical protein
MEQPAEGGLAHPEPCHAPQILASLERVAAGRLRRSASNSGDHNGCTGTR